MANNENMNKRPQGQAPQAGRPVAPRAQKPMAGGQAGRPGGPAQPGGRESASAAKAAAAKAAGAVRAAGKGGSKRTVLIVVGCVVAALAIWLLVWLFACGGAFLDPNAQTGQAPYKSEEEIQAELDRQVEEGMFNISIASIIQFEDGTASGTAYIENVPSNHYNMRVTITDDATGDTLYSSGVLKPNQYIEDIVLAKDLGAGTYDATATFTALDPNSNDEVGQAAAKITLNVLG